MWGFPLVVSISLFPATESGWHKWRIESVQEFIDLERVPVSPGGHQLFRHSDHPVSNRCIPYLILDTSRGGYLSPICLVPSTVVLWQWPQAPGGHLPAQSPSVASLWLHAKTHVCSGGCHASFFLSTLPLPTASGPCRIACRPLWTSCISWSIAPGASAHTAPSSTDATLRHCPHVFGQLTLTF